MKLKSINRVELEVAKGKRDANLIWTLQLELNDLVDKESQMCHQRSRALFLKEGN